MKKQIVSILTLIICAMFAETTAIAQGIIIHKKNGEEIIVPYSALDSIATYTAEGNNEEINGHECVDLGLSVRWATCNVGAYSPEENGGYYAWGETEEKSGYSLSTYKWKTTNTNMWRMKKYSTYSDDSDFKTTLDPEDDVAHVKWGGSWRMPTKDEIMELVDKCTWEPTKHNNVNGCLVTGPNGNSIFLPATGFCNGEDPISMRGVSLDYWSATLEVNKYNDLWAYRISFFFDSNPSYSSFARHGGLSVRPVTE